MLDAPGPWIEGFITQLRPVGVTAGDDLDGKIAFEFKELRPMQKEYTFWQYRPVNGLTLSIRKEPKAHADKEGKLQPGESFDVSKEVAVFSPGNLSILFLKLADGRGWVPERSVAAGKMCHRIFMD
jgi:hypothetical protein